MSHFTALVIDTEGVGYETLLEPYDETLDTAPYWSPEAAVPQDLWYFKTFVEEGLITPDATFGDLLRARAKKWDDEGPLIAHSPTEFSQGENRYRITDTGLEEQSTYNPNSRWDYYTLGGRWRGSLLLKEGKEGMLGPRSPFDDGEPVTEGWTDQAVKADLDLERQRKEAGERAEVVWDLVDALVQQHGALPSSAWTELDSADPKFAEGRAAYWDNPTVKAIKDSNLVGFFGPMPDREFGCSREEYVELGQLRAVPGYATLIDDHWHEKGRMGWFGMGTDTPVSELEYLREVNKAIDETPDDAVFSVVDCHI